MSSKTRNARQLTELGEFGLIGLVAARAGTAEHVPIGIGDDAAAFRWQNGCLGLATSDMLLEGVHFDLSYCDPWRLGRKSLAVNLSDMAAMGGRPRNFLLSLAIPATISVEFVDEFSSGLLDLANDFEVKLLGGDTCSSRSGLIVSITLYGEQEQSRIVKRTGALPGDAVFVTGTLGDSALGLELLRKGQREGYCIERHLDPKPRVGEGMALAESRLVSAMIDVSDGLLADLGHITDSSGVGARLWLDRIPLSSEFAAHFANGCSGRHALAFSGGEDYELLFTAPAHRCSEIRELLARFGTPVAEIGEITANPGILVVSPEGSIVPVAKAGFDHFTCPPPHI